MRRWGCWSRQRLDRWTSSSALGELLRGQIAFSSGVGSDAATLLLKAAKRLESLDLDLARGTYLDALGAAQLAGPAGASVLAKRGNE